VKALWAALPGASDSQSPKGLGCRPEKSLEMMRQGAGGALCVSLAAALIPRPGQPFDGDGAAMAMLPAAPGSQKMA
jgi:hypothetical protein